MKKTNVLKRILCICVIAVTLLALTSCNVGDMKDKDSAITVVKVKSNIEAGKQLTADMFETVKVPETAVPLNAIRDVRKIEGKYNTQAFYAGEYVFMGKLSESDPAKKNAIDYESNFVVTEKIDVKGDISDALQQLIDKNPGKTFEFPDGEYVLSKPVKVPADPAKAVSLRLSDFAVIKAADSWSSSEAMFCLSAGTIPEGSELVNTFYLTGGLFDGNGKATAISVENGENLLISGVDFKNVVTAIDVKGGIVDVENCDVIGAGSGSVALKVAGEYSTYTNVRVSNADAAVNVSGNNNLFKSVYATYENKANQLCAFVDTSSMGNNYDMCTSENFATGFSVGTGTSTYSGCYVKWESTSITKQVAFLSTGKFNSVIRTSRVDFDFANCGGAYLADTTEGGAGQILWPMIGGVSNMADTSYTSYLKGTAAVFR